MRKTHLALLVAFTIASGGFRSSYAAVVSAGIAVADITPPIGGLTVGYETAQPTDGIHSPITARVLVLHSPDTTVALVAWDLCVETSPWLHGQMAALGIDHLLLLNTHTHAGPNIDQPDFPSKDNPLRGTTERKVLEAIKQAKQTMFPATFAARDGSIQLGYNRLVRQPDGYARTHFENPERIPYGPVDPTVSVLRITDEKGAVRAVLVNYACHAVVFGPANRKLSADYPGAMRQEVETRLGGNAVCFFLQGAAGDINPLMLARSADAAKDAAVVETMGKTLAEEVLRVLTQLQSAPGKSGHFSASSTMLTVANRWRRDESRKLRVSTLLLNSDIAMIAMPGEPFQAFQVDWRRKAGVPHAFFLGYCAQSTDPWAGYIPDVVAASRGGYGASDSTDVAVGTGERLLTEGLVQLYTLQGRLKPAPQRHLNE
ncbi:MAG: neutral/alkaline non-lysosomal ceramidase N-terminal domain-containing protein [Opitutus sp.]